MYCEFYQLTERPFNVTPDPKFLYLNARYREAIASLNYGITQRRGFITLIGEAGTGKTTLLNKLLDDLDPKTKSVFIFNTNVTFEEILEYIFAEFDLPVHNGKKLYMLQCLNTFLLNELRAGANVALLIDEAQDLEFSVLEDLRLLSNLETAKEKILQIVLSGQPELGQKLSNPVLRQLRQRIGINCRLLPLSRDEVTEYIQYRLQAAGCPDLKLFSREAEERIYHFSRGIPRLVNVVCDNALVIGYALGKKRIGADLITEAAADLLSNEQVAEDADAQPAPASAITVSPPAAPSRRRARVAMMALLILAMAVGLLFLGRTMLPRQNEEPQVAASEPPKLEVIRPGSETRNGTVDFPITRSAERLKDVAVTAPRAGAPDAPTSPPRGLAAAEPVSSSDAANSAPAKGQESGDTALVTAESGSGPRSARPDAAAPTAAQNTYPATARDTADKDKEGSGVGSAATGVRPALETGPVVPARVLEQRQTAEAPIAKIDEGGAIADAAPQKAEAALAETATAAADEADADRDREQGRRLQLDGMQFGQVVVRGGDSMSGIAMRRYGQVTYTILDLLKLANPELKDINLITIGQTIRLPDLGNTFPVLRDGSGRYSLLVYSSPQGGRAAALRNALRSRGYDAHINQGSVGYQKPVFRVIVWGHGGREELAGLGRQLQKLFREDNRIASVDD